MYSSRHDTSRSGSFSSDEGSHSGRSKPLEEPILVYHESARSIVFRDQLRRAVGQKSSSNSVMEVKPETTSSPRMPREKSGNSIDTEVPEISSHSSSTSTIIAGFQPKIVPLPALERGPGDEYKELLDSKYDESADGFTEAESEVCRMLREQKCTVKTIKNVDWTDFLNRFHRTRGHSPDGHDDIAPDNDTFPFNSFVTSTSLLPPDGKRMRCYGSTNQYTVGVVFALPSQYANAAEEDEAAARTKTWSWPAGYSVRTDLFVEMYVRVQSTSSII
jgi:hypothetical protein